jgi:hypothetical protein
MLGRNWRSNVRRLGHGFFLHQKRERLVTFSLCKTKIVELIEVSVLKNVVCGGFFFCDFLKISSNDIVSFL